MSTQLDVELTTEMTTTSCPSNNELNRELTEIHMEINKELSENHLMPKTRPKRWLLYETKFPLELLVSIKKLMNNQIVHVQLINN